MHALGTGGSYRMEAVDAPARTRRATSPTREHVTARLWLTGDDGRLRWTRAGTCSTCSRLYPLYSTTQLRS
jgi:hypothetical protein